MFCVYQDSYEDLKDATAHGEHPLVVHAGAVGKGRNLVVFVHGLRGTRYGYWGRFPEFIFNDIPNTDVGLYYYKTALKRIGLNSSIDLQSEGRILADEIKSLKQYKAITLICHSMGGLLAKAAICSLLDRNIGFALRKITGLVLLACPQLGSLRVPSWLRWVSADARALYPHNELLRRFDETFSARLLITRSADPRDKYSIPTWAVVAANDFWVDPLSAGIGLPPDQKHTVRGAHSQIVRPSVSTDSTYKFVLECVDTTFKPASESDDDETELRAMPATPQDVERVRLLAVSFFGEDVTSESDLSDLIAERLVGVVRRTIVTSDFEKRDRLVGYWVLIPLDDQSADAVCKRLLRGADLGPTHGTRDVPKTIYIGAIAAADFNSRGLVLEALRRQVSEWRSKGIEELLTRLVTKDGLRLVRRYGFKSVDGAPMELGCICTAKVSGVLQKFDQ